MKLAIVFIGTFACLMAAAFILRNSTLEQIAQALSQGDFAKFDEAVNTFFARYFIDRYTRHSLCLEALMLQKKSKRAYEEMNQILSFRLTLSQQQELLGKCFYYFLSENREEYAKTTLSYIGKVKNEAMYQDCKLFYDVLMQKEDSHLEETLQLLETNTNNRGVLEYLAGLQYSYRKDRENAGKHLENAAAELRGTPYEAAIRQLLKEMKKENEHRECNL